MKKHKIHKAKKAKEAILKILDKSDQRFMNANIPLWGKYLVLGQNSYWRKIFNNL